MELRQTFLRRNGRGVVLTEAGQLLLEHGRGILHQVERAREELGRVRGALAGRVAVGLPPTIAKLMAVPLVKAFRQQMPEASLSISEGLSSAMGESLAHLHALRAQGLVSGRRGDDGVWRFGAA